MLAAVRGRRRRRRRGDGCALGQHLAALPRLDRRGAEGHRARHRARPGGDPQHLVLLGGGAHPVRAPSRAISRAGASEVYLHEMPGGQFTNLKEQARSLGLETRWHEVAQTYADVNQMFGDIVKVTPSSKVVGDMALMMVSQDLTRRRRRGPGSGHRLPRTRWSSMLRGDLGQPPGGWPAGAAEEGAEGRDADHRPARLAARSRRSRRRAQARPRRRSGSQLDDCELASYLMYPEGLHRLRRGAGDLRPDSRAADAGLFLRHAAGRRDPRRPRKGQDAGHALPGDRRDRREGHGHACSSS